MSSFWCLQFVIFNLLRDDDHTHFVTKNLNLTLQACGWVGKNIFTMTFCVTKRFRRKSHFIRKIIINKKYYNAHLFSISSSYLFLVLKGFLNSALVISQRKKLPTLHFYSLQYAEKGREKTASYLYAVSGTI